MRPDPALQVLAHPLRGRLVHQLRVAGPATATELAASLGTNSGATSYHLRRLEAAGLVHDTGHGAGKRRVWQVSDRGSRSLPSDVAGDADAESALEWLARDYVGHFAEQYERWLSVRRDWPLAWQDSTGAREAMVLVTTQQLRDMTAELALTVDRYRRVGQGNPRARRVAAYTFAYPLDLDRPPRPGATP